MSWLVCLVITEFKITITTNTQNSDYNDQHILFDCINYLQMFKLENRCVIVPMKFSEARKTKWMRKNLRWWLYYFLFLWRKPKINFVKKGDSGLDPSFKKEKNLVNIIITYLWNWDSEIESTFSSKLIMLW